MQMLSAFFTSNAFSKGRKMQYDRNPCSTACLTGLAHSQGALFCIWPLQQSNSITILIAFNHSGAGLEVTARLLLAGPARCNVMGVFVRSIEFYCSFFCLPSLRFCSSDRYCGGG